MITERTKELINKQLDAVNTLEEQRELHAILSSQPEAKALYDGLKETCSMLEAVSTQIDPPQDLRANINQALPAEGRKRSPYRSHISVTEFLVVLFSKQTVVFGMGAVAGVILFIAGSFLWKNGGSVESEEVYGTINIARSANGNNLSTDVQFSNEQYRALVSFKPTDRTISAHINVQTPGQSTLVFEFDRTQLNINGFQRLSGDYNIVSMGNDASISMETGDHDCKLDFERKNAKATTLYVKMFNGNELVFERRIVLDGQL